MRNSSSTASPSPDTEPAGPPTGEPAAASTIDRRRYRRVRWFFARVFIHFIWWDILLNRPVLRWFRPEPVTRWRRIARRYRELAVQMGGVLIKLGQFLSIRVDILPREVTGELSGLQDEVPPEPAALIIAQVESDLGRPLADVFEFFSPTPLGAASLAQVHPARTIGGEALVVKVLRPGIQRLVETDLAALALALRWLKFSRTIRQRVDLDWLGEEFTTVTRRELNLTAEGRNIEQFARDFAEVPEICVPKVHWQVSGPKTLAMENVGYIKISDTEAIEAAGIRRADVADRLYHLYMRQVFETYFVHVDPHPGNLFIRPLPTAEEAEAGIEEFAPGAPVPHREGREFQIVLVDFGMVSAIPERLRSSIREYAIGIGTRDAWRIIQAYLDAGILLPGADLKRLEEAHNILFSHFWGVRVGQLRDVALSEAATFIDEYRDVIWEAPFQFQVDLLFVLRAVGILSGLATQLDPEFDVWAKTIPFARKFARDEFEERWQGWLQEAVSAGQLLWKFSSQVDRLLTRARRGEMTVQASLSTGDRQAIQAIGGAVRQLVWMVAAGALLISGVTLHLSTGFVVAAAVACIAALKRR